MNLCWYLYKTTTWKIEHVIKQSLIMKIKEHRMDKDFYGSLKYAFELRGEMDKFDSVRKRIDTISDYEEIKQIHNDKQDELFQWIPTIVFNLFGYEAYRNCDLNVDNDKTIILFRPNQIYDFSIIEEFHDIGLETYKYEYRFTPWLVASIYGGFPWFNSYYKLCEKLDLLNKCSYMWTIKSINGEKCIRKVVEMKNEFRKKHPEQTFELLLPDNKFNGVIHSFHTPNCIENEMHMKAVERMRLE